MNYFLAGLTVAAFIVMLCLAVYMPYLGLQVSQGKTTSANAMTKGFLFTLIAWFLMLFSVAAWKSKPEWDIKTWIFLLIICALISIAVALLSSLAFLRWKK